MIDALPEATNGYKIFYGGRGTTSTSTPTGYDGYPEREEWMKYESAEEARDKKSRLCNNKHHAKKEKRYF